MHNCEVAKLINDYSQSLSDNVERLSQIVSITIPMSDDDKYIIHKALSLLKCIDTDIKSAKTMVQLNDIVNIDKISTSWQIDRLSLDTSDFVDKVLLAIDSDM